MVDNLAIVAGFGALSREVDVLADTLTGSHFRYAIKPWFLDPIRRIMEALRQTNRITGLDPFCFSDIELEFRDKQIKHIFLTGDFPWDRYLQERIAEALPSLFKIADRKCAAYFEATPTSFSRAVRYFIALSRFLDDLEIKPLLASQIFPDLNLAPGCLSERPLPPSFLDHISDVVMSALLTLHNTQHRRNRFSQAVIVDRNVICAVETTGTEAMLRHYGNSKLTRSMPVLLKLPSADFFPALDQPTIGPDTVAQCKRAGVQGIVVCAETTVVVEKTAVVGQINALGMFLYAVPFSQLREIYLRHSPNSWAQTATTDLPLR
jgi:DUF1009 family protein